MGRLRNAETGRLLIVPIDDSLINGPFGGLHDLHGTLGEINLARPDAVLGFVGQFERYASVLKDPSIAWIANVTASTKYSHHTDKRLIHSVRRAIACGCDGVAAHLNLTSDTEGAMIANLAAVVEEARGLGTPVLAIVYPRKTDADGRDDNYDELRVSNPEQYVDLVSHCVRVAVDVGASIVKTQYTGDPISFSRVVTAANGVPVVIAGGHLVSEGEALARAAEAITAGAAGVSFGRNVFNRRHVGRFIGRLRRTINEAASDG